MPPLSACDWRAGRCSRLAATGGPILQKRARAEYLTLSGSDHETFRIGSELEGGIEERRPGRAAVAASRGFRVTFRQ
jgi:hypothetical protein